jgi:MoaA/NifB/PqqE/SkfB family radical SAM enzyme
MEGIIAAWGRILTGYTPNLSIEITRECPLRCPGCYAYGADHLGGDINLRQVADYKGEALVTEVLRLVREHKALHLSIVGGEPLVRFRELNDLLPKLADMGIYTQLVTSAVRPIPIEWAGIRRLQLVVSIDGLQPEHDVRRTPATYDRILKHIKGHKITVHCTVTRQQVRRDGYLDEFIDFWSNNPDTSQIWVSLYTPQIGEVSEERLLPADREKVVADLIRLRKKYPKLRMPEGMIKVYLTPPDSPSECTFAQTTTCFSADLKTNIAPCQFGGNPDCSQCGCIASAGLKAVGAHRIMGGTVRVGAIFETSLKVGQALRNRREAIA